MNDPSIEDNKEAHVPRYTNLQMTQPVKKQSFHHTKTLFDNFPKYENEVEQKDFDVEDNLKNQKKPGEIV